MNVYVTDPETGEPVHRVLGPDEFPSRICVFCDGCGSQVEADYVVSEAMSSSERLEVARRHLRGQGWRCDVSGDFCPACTPKEG